jgi:hypothetical protein
MMQNDVRVFYNAAAIGQADSIMTVFTSSVVFLGGA